MYNGVANCIPEASPWIYNRSELNFSLICPWSLLPENFKDSSQHSKNLTRPIDFYHYSCQDPRFCPALHYGRHPWATAEHLLARNATHGLNDTISVAPNHEPQKHIFWLESFRLDNNSSFTRTYRGQGGVDLRCSPPHKG